jgi:hypothetical protein
MQCTIVVPAGQIFLKFCIGDVLRKTVDKLKVKLKSKDKTLSTSHEELILLHIVGSDKCSATVHRTHGCASMATIRTFIVLPTAIYVGQQYESKALLVTMGYEKALQYYVIRSPLSLLNNTGRITRTSVKTASFK